MDALDKLEGDVQEALATLRRWRDTPASPECPEGMKETASEMTESDWLEQLVMLVENAP